MWKWKRNSNKSGYILVETLVSVVILAVGLILVLNAFSAEINALRTSKNYTHASLLLEQKLCELEEQGGIDIIEWGKREKNGRFQFPNERFEWKIDIEPMYEEAQALGIVKVTVTVEWKEISVVRELSATAYMCKIAS